MDFKAISDHTEHSPSDFSILARRDEATAQLETLRRERGAALLDGQTFDDAAIREAERQLDALSDIEAVQVGRERKAAAQALQAHVAGLRAKLVKTERHRLNAVERAEEAARALASALKHAKEHSDEIEKLVKALGGTVPPNMTSAEAEKRLSNRIGDAMMPLTGIRRRYGNLVFREPLGHERGEWKAGEEKLAAAMIAAVTEGN